MSKLLVDGATGSHELIAPLQKLGLPAEKAHLEFGDVAFLGRGCGGERLYIGIELKKIGELVQSMCSTKRLQGHQLLGLVQDFDRRYLLIEGDYHSDTKGNAVVFRGVGQPRPLPGAPSAITLEQEIINIQTRGGVWVRHTTTRKDTLRFLCACYRYWTDKDLDEHKSHLAMYAPDLDKGLLTPPSDFRKALTVILPGIGFAVSATVENYVGKERGLKEQLQRVLNMREEEWAALEVQSRKGQTKKFGASRAKQIMEAWK
jgi:hypothetical protein